MNKKTYALTAQGIHKKFPLDGKAINVLNGIDIKIERGKITSVIGASGAGKSTLLYILSGLLNPSKGKVYMGANDLYGISEEARSRLINEKIGFVFQDYQLLSDLNVMDNICLPALLMKTTNSGSKIVNIKKEANHLIRKLNMGHRIKHFPSQLSGGELQRVAIIRALINKPEIIYCDEPTGNLDSANTSLFASLIIELNKRLGHTFVIVTHDHKMSEISDKAYKIVDGKLFNR